MDLSLRLEDDTDPVPPDGTFHYLAHVSSAGPVLATGGSLRAEIDEGHPITFTGAYTQASAVRWSCDRADPRTMTCTAPAAVGSTLGFEVRVGAGAPPGAARACAHVDYRAPGGGRDPNPDNNHDCEETVIRGAVGDIGWRVVRGVVYRATDAPAHTLTGATVTCKQASYFPRDGSCAPHAIETGPDGAFAFDVHVHDTDRITIAADRPGYAGAEITLNGVECAGSCPELSLVLEPLLRPLYLPRLRLAR